MILDEETKEKYGKCFDDAYGNQYIVCICDYCGNLVEKKKSGVLKGRKTVIKDSCNNKECKKKKIKDTCLAIFGCESPFHSKAVQDKKTETFKKKYGVDSIGASKEIRKKIKLTNEARYGGPAPMCSEVVKEKFKKTSIEVYGFDNPRKNKEVQETAKKTYREKFGVDSPLESPEVRKKIAKTNLENLGVENPWQSPIVREKIKKSCKENIGVENPFYSKEIQNKIQEKNIVRFNAKTPFESEEIQKKIRENNLKTLGVEYPLQSELVREVIKKNNLEKFGHESPFGWVATHEKIRATNVEKYGVPYPIGNYGGTQNEVKEWLSSFGFNFNANWEILLNKEIDLYNEDLKLAIEYCGLYWHNEQSPSPRDKWYHHSKFKKCSEKNIRLLTIFSDEWEYRKTQCKNYIKSLLGKYEKKIFARKCSIKEIDKKQFREFCDDYHIQGSAKLGKIFYGLFFEDELVGGMSLGYHHRKKGILLLDRLCFKDGIQVVGGASKLFSACKNWAIENGHKEIVSFSDNRWSAGHVYISMGFELDKELPPDYSYVDISSTDKRHSKQSQKKSNTNCPEGMTELEWATERGLARIWDCGKKRWKYKLENNNE